MPEATPKRVPGYPRTRIEPEGDGALEEGRRDSLNPRTGHLPKKLSFQNGTQREEEKAKRVPRNPLKSTKLTVRTYS
jgi:hypothetical protein